MTHLLAARPRRSFDHRRLLLGVVASLAALALTACGKNPAGASTHTAAAAPAGSPAAAALTKIVVQLDWVAEPEHGGFYQAQAKGCFKAAGRVVEIIIGNRWEPAQVIDALKRALKPAR